LLKTEIQFPVKYLSLHGPIDALYSILVAYIKKQLEIATQVSVINVKVTVAKIGNPFPLYNLSFSFAD